MNTETKENWILSNSGNINDHFDAGHGEKSPRSVAIDRKQKDTSAAWPSHSCGQSKTSLSRATVPQGGHAFPAPTGRRPLVPSDPPGRKDRPLGCPTHPAIVRASFPALGSGFDKGADVHTKPVMRNRSGQTEDWTPCLSACPPIPACLPDWLTD